MIDLSEMFLVSPPTIPPLDLILLFTQVRLQLTPDAFILQREELCFGGVPGAPLDGATGSDFSIHDTLNSDGDSRFSDQQVSWERG